MPYAIHPVIKYFRHAGLLAALGIGICTDLAWAAKSEAPASASVLPVVLKGQDVPPLLGKSPLRLSAFTCLEGKPKPIVFQVDEVNADNRVIPPDASERMAKDEQPGVIDANDEIVLLLRDLGEKCSAEQLASARGRLVTVQVSSAHLREPAMVYLLESDRGFVPSESAVRYDARTDSVVAEGYTFGYDPKRPFLFLRMIYPDFRARAKDDVLDRLKVRIHVKALGSMIKLNVDEDDFEAEMDGVRAGPVRIVREMTIRIKAVPGLTLTALARFSHYGRMMHADIRVKFSKVVALAVSSLDMSIFLDFTDIRGVRVITSGLPEGALVDGKMIQQEKAMTLGSLPWFMLSGGGLNQIAVIDLDKDLTVEPVAVFIDDPAYADPPEEVPGAMPTAGYEFRGWENLKAKWYFFEARIAALPAVPEGGGSGFYKIVHQPF